MFMPLYSSILLTQESCSITIDIQEYACVSFPANAPMVLKNRRLCKDKFNAVAMSDMRVLACRSSSYL